MNQLRALWVAPALCMLVACGGAAKGAQVAQVGTNTPSNGANASPVSDDSLEQGRKFAQCMRDNGIADFPDPEPGEGGGVGIRIGGEGMDRAAMEKAMQACRDLLPKGGPMKSMSPEDLAQMREFAQCMRDNGVDMPDPDPNGGGVVVEKRADGGGRVNGGPSDPDFQKAMEACKDKMRVPEAAK